MKLIWENWTREKVISIIFTLLTLSIDFFSAVAKNLMHRWLLQTLSIRCYDCHRILLLKKIPEGKPRDVICPNCGDVTGVLFGSGRGLDVNVVKGIKLIFNFYSLFIPSSTQQGLSLPKG